jgi:hypothetical protein
VQVSRGNSSPGKDSSSICTFDHAVVAFVASFLMLGLHAKIGLQISIQPHPAMANPIRRLSGSSCPHSTLAVGTRFGWARLVSGRDRLPRWSPTGGQREEAKHRWLHEAANTAASRGGDGGASTGAP